MDIIGRVCHCKQQGCSVCFVNLSVCWQEYTKIHQTLWRVVTSVCKNPLHSCKIYEALCFTRTGGGLHPPSGHWRFPDSAHAAVSTLRGAPPL